MFACTRPSMPLSKHACQSRKHNSLARVGIGGLRSSVARRESTTPTLPAQAPSQPSQQGLHPSQWYGRVSSSGVPLLVANPKNASTITNCGFSRARMRRAAPCWACWAGRAGAEVCTVSKPASSAAVAWLLLTMPPSSARAASTGPATKQACASHDHSPPSYLEHLTCLLYCSPC